MSMKPRKLSAGVLQLVEAALDDVAEPVEGAIYCHAQLAGLAYRVMGTTLRASMVLRTLSESWPRSASRTQGAGGLSAMTGSKPS